MTKLNYNKILLIHPLGYDTKRAKSDISRIANIMPPLGLISIAAYLESHQIKTKVIDCFATPFQSDTLIKNCLIENKPGFIGISCTTSSFLDAVRIAKYSKSIYKNLKIIIGGPHVSALKEKVLIDYPIIDVLVIGEGEETILNYINNHDGDLSLIKGIVYNNNDNVVFTGYSNSIIELDSLPFPAYEKLDFYPAQYQLPIFDYPKSPNSSCVSSRGCPYSCSYCDRSVFRSSFRFNSANYLYEHLKYLKERFKIKHINFYDDQFTFNRKRVIDFTELLINNSLDISFNCAVRAEHIDDDLLKRMKQANCWMISLGIETGDEVLLSKHRKNANLEFLSTKIYSIKKAGIRTKGLLMMGLPGESLSSIKKSMDYVFSHPVDTFNLAKFTPFPGSPLYKNIHDLGDFNEDWEKMDCMNFLFIPKGMTKDQLEKAFIEFYKTHFKRFKVVIGYVTMLWKSPHSWLRFSKNILHFLKFIIRSKRLET